MAPGSRIVTVTSEVYQMSVVRFDDYNFSDRQPYYPWKGYGKSKTANILSTVELARRAASKDALAYSVHPGVIPGTGLGDEASKELSASAKALWLETHLGEPPYRDPRKTLQQGCANTIVAAFSPSIAGESGSFLEDCVVQHDTVKPWVRESAKAERFWKLGEELVGQRFECQRMHGKVKL